MKKYIVLTLMVVGLFSASYGFSASQNNIECKCNQSGVCSCASNCECISCRG